VGPVQHGAAAAAAAATGPPAHQADGPAAAGAPRQRRSQVGNKLPQRAVQQQVALPCTDTHAPFCWCALHATAVDRRHNRHSTAESHLRVRWQHFGDHRKGLLQRCSVPASQALFSVMSSRTPSCDRPAPKSFAQQASAAASARLLAPCIETELESQAEMRPEARLPMYQYA
jgi:hypothetical protein